MRVFLVVPIESPRFLLTIRAVRSARFPCYGRLSNVMRFLPFVPFMIAGIKRLGVRPDRGTNVWLISKSEMGRTGNDALY